VRLWTLFTRKLKSVRFCSLLKRILFTHKLNIVHSQTEYCVLTNWTLSTYKLNIIHWKTKHCSLIMLRLFTYEWTMNLHNNISCNNFKHCRIWKFKSLRDINIAISRLLDIIGVPIKAQWMFEFCLLYV